MVRPCSCPASDGSWQGGAKTRSTEHAVPEKLNAAVAVIGVGAIVLRQKWSRGQGEARFADLPPYLVGIEACVGAHHPVDGLRRLVTTPG
jgi:hypothetical protein